MLRCFCCGSMPVYRLYFCRGFSCLTAAGDGRRLIRKVTRRGKQKVTSSTVNKTTDLPAMMAAQATFGAPPAAFTTTATEAAAAPVRGVNELRGDVTIAAHDPAAVVKFNSRLRQLHITPVQRELIWNARRRQYQQLLRRIVVCLQSHLAPIAKCHALLALHEEVIEKRIRLRADTYEDIFYVFCAVATLGSATSSLATEEAVDRCGFSAPSSSSSLLPYEFANAKVAAASLLAAPVLQSLWTMYRYMIDSGTNPTSRIVQHVMGVLERQDGKDAIVEARAHSLMMDLDRFHLTPTEYTITAYIGLCDKNAVMHLAVARVTDYRTRHERQASPGIYTRLLFGLLHNHQYEEAMSCLTTIDSVTVTPHLLNAVLNVARHSRDPLSAFAFYRSVMGKKGNNMTSSSHTISILLEVMCATECFAELDFLLQEMRRHRVKGNNVMLNKLLKVLLRLRRYADAKRLCAAMTDKGVLVFDELRKQCDESLHTPSD